LIIAEYFTSYSLPIDQLNKLKQQLNLDIKKFQEGKEWLIIFAKEILKQKNIDYFIFGHRHLPLNYKLNETSSYFNLGDWIKYNSYAVFDGENTELKFYNND
jgi:UDP-2,3-diacylglucosamine hydrolase